MTHQSGTPGQHRRNHGTTPCSWGAEPATWSGTGCDAHNARMSALGYEIIAIETHGWPDGLTETEVVWGRDDAITDADLPF
jgi:hypothetical protein